MQKWAEDFRRWIGQKIGTQETRTQSVQASKQIIAELPRQRPDVPRQSRGYRM